MRGLGLKYRFGSKAAFSSLFALASVLGCVREHGRSMNPSLGTLRVGGSEMQPAPRSASQGGERPKQPPRVVAPMPGEPSGEDLARTRLVESSCEDSPERARREADLLVRRMRREVDAEYEDWKRAQPGCWQEYRERERDGFRSGSGRLDGATGAFGSAWGLGLSGVGEGGGGVGMSRGTIGHGAGTAVSQDFQTGSRVTRSPARSARPGSAKSASATNTQRADVDEADIVKNDDRYVYVAMNGALRIVEALKPRLLSVTRFKGRVREMFVEGDRALLYLSKDGSGTPRCRYGYDCVFGGDGSSTEIVVLDVSDRRAPKLARRIELSGSLITARRIGSAVHTVVSDGDAPVPTYSTWPDGLETCGTREAAVRARFARLKLENARWIRDSLRVRFPSLSEKGVKETLCDNLLRTRIRDGAGFTSVVSIDLDRDDDPPVTATLQSRPGAIFASASALYFSVAHRRSETSGAWFPFLSAQDEVSDVHKFRLGSKASETRYLSSGVVPGHVLNQFSMDEWYGYLRIATTRGKVPDPSVESAVSVLADDGSGSLVRVGAVPHIAPGEDIRAVRFDGDRGYVVTFKKTDPLFVLDLWHPARPGILGELKIPGFSTYMQRIDPDHLLSIGFDAHDQGDFAYFDGLLLQLFDVKKPTQPKLLHKQKIGTRGSSSEAATDHHAFNYFADRGLLAIPATVCEGGAPGVNGKPAFSGLLVYELSLETGFKRLGAVDHGARAANCDAWWSDARSAVKRSVFLDDLVYSVATDRVKVQRMGRFGEDVANIALRP
jgi:hypothetical protein